MWFFYYFNFERNYGVITSKGEWFLLSKTSNVSKIETELIMENHANTFRDMSFTLQLI